MSDTPSTIRHVYAEINTATAITKQVAGQLKILVSAFDCAVVSLEALQRQVYNAERGKEDKK